MKYIRISRYEKGESSQLVPDLKGRLVRLPKYNFVGSHIQPPGQVINSIDGELDCDIELGTKIVLEVIEMSKDDYKQLPEFTGY